MLGWAAPEEIARARRDVERRDNLFRLLDTLCSRGWLYEKEIAFVLSCHKQLWNTGGLATKQLADLEKIARAARRWRGTR
jgi:hypothetical protein